MRTLTTLARLCAAFALVVLTLADAHAAGIGGLARWLEGVDLVEPIAAPRIALLQPTLAPFAYARFCHENPADCRGGASAFIAMTPHARRLIERVNRQVNAAIAPRHDPADVWLADPVSGDCADYALTKRRALIRARLPASALSIAVARTRFGEGHAVLVARTSAGDFVLDNRTELLREWHRTDLALLKIASSENPRIWYAVR